MEIIELLKIYNNKGSELNISLVSFIVVYLIYKKEFKELSKYLNNLNVDISNQILNSLRFNCYIEFEDLNDLSSIILSSKSYNLFEVSKDDITTIIEYLNKMTDSTYRTKTAKTRSLINARLVDYTVEDIKLTIKYKVLEWSGTEYSKYLRPDTLFNDSKFDYYYNQMLKNKQVDTWTTMK